jgi:hypothetical protein
MKHIVAVVAVGALAAIACKHHEEAHPTPSSPVASAVSTPAAPPPPIVPFEGEITMSLTEEGTVKVPPSVTFDVKGDRVRESPLSSPVRAIADVAGNHEYAINDARKVYSSLDATEPTKEATKKVDVTVNRSPWTEKIAGIVCSLWSIDDGTEKVDVCAAKGIPFFDLAAQPKPGKIEPRWASLLTREKAFPLTLVVHDEAGKEEYRGQATKIEARRLDDALFQIPGGFKSADLSADLHTASLP